MPVKNAGEILNSIEYLLYICGIFWPPQFAIPSQTRLHILTVPGPWSPRRRAQSQLPRRRYFGFISPDVHHQIQNPPSLHLRLSPDYHHHTSIFIHHSGLIHAPVPRTPGKRRDHSLNSAGWYHCLGEDNRPQPTSLVARPLSCASCPKAA